MLPRYDKRMTWVKLSEIDECHREFVFITDAGSQPPGDDLTECTGRRNAHGKSKKEEVGRRLALLHRAFVFAEGLLFHRNDSGDAFLVDDDLEIDGDGAVDPFATAGI